MAYGLLSTVASEPDLRTRFVTHMKEMDMISRNRAGILLVAPALALVGAGALAADGKSVYEKTCNVCHADGVAGAPKLGDKAAWAPRIAGGKDTLVASVVKGKGAMPAKAGNAALSVEEIKSAVEFLVTAVK